MKEPTTDDIYAYALSKTLTKVSSPATVGLYSLCQDRINMILKQMEEYMDQEASKIEQEYDERPKPRTAKPSFFGFLALIGRMLFDRPVWTEKNQRHCNVRFIYVHFSAWHFAGSDLLWAGIVIRLIQAMQMSFGKFQLALYNVAQHNEEDEIKKKVVKDGPNDWDSKKICCCPLWLLVPFFLMLPVIILVLLLVYGFSKGEALPGDGKNETNGHVDAFEGLFLASLGVPALSALKFIFQMGKNLIFSQDLNIRRTMDNERISSQLGFMNEVRKEIWFLSRFVQFMEVFERRRIRIVLKITNLDRCTPKKITAVLEAIDILLSDEEGPFISILAVNPDVLLEKVNFADGCFCKEDRAYALLNRIVTLAFTVPPLSENLKRNLFYSLTDKHRKKRSSADTSVLEIVLEPSASYPLINRNTAALDVKEENLFKHILAISERKLNKYMLDDAISMRRVINSVRVTVIIMMALKGKLSRPENIAAWVVLANQWPCRLSWIIQCVEDAKQRAAIDGKNAHGDHSQSLWEVFNESREELYVMGAQIEDLLEQDGDPEMFEELLKDDNFEFTVNSLATFQVGMVNLDQSIKRELALIRGASRLKGSGWMRDLAPLPITTIIKMSTADVCKEMERMEYDSKYTDIVKANKLNGSALVFGDTDDLKALLGMSFGEWANFRLHFLSLSSHRRSHYKNKLPSPVHSEDHLLKLQHAPHHYSSNLNLLHSCT
ncbi:NTPase KAP family P-loop domain-containing protein 1 isoform 1-T2 [Odontesthes bonariensis]|uniref:NTPase KAP family P-loop domain-containing protein 1 isoform X1 n=1 Tax=Odontesthes bonariensis TaxID=219752 RepID=UPI003F584F98